MKSSPFEALSAVRDQLELALKQGGNVDGFTDLWQNIARGSMQLFAAGRSVVVTQIQEYPRARVLQLCYAAGALTDMEPWIDEVFAWAKRKGCTKVVMTGRWGWERSFLRRYLQPTNVVMEGIL